MQASKLRSIIEENKDGAGELVIFEGLHAVKHALRFGAKPEILVTESREELLELGQKLCPDILESLEQATEIEGFDEITDSQVRTNVIGIFNKPKLPESSFAGRSVLIDYPRDLNNLGAVIRVCAATGIKNLIITGSSNPWNSRAIRGAAGLQFALNLHNLDYPEIAELKIPLICFDERGEELTDNIKTKIPENSILVFGSERDGISTELKVRADLIVKLPMQKGVSSLNLATSVSAALYSLK